MTNPMETFFKSVFFNKMRRTLSLIPYINKKHFINTLTVINSSVSKRVENHKRQLGICRGKENSFPKFMPTPMMHFE